MKLNLIFTLFFKTYVLIFIIILNQTCFIYSFPHDSVFGISAVSLYGMFTKLVNIQGQGRVLSYYGSHYLDSKFSYNPCKLTRVDGNNYFADVNDCVSNSVSDYFFYCILTKDITSSYIDFFTLYNALGTYTEFISGFNHAGYNFKCLDIETVVNHCQAQGELLNINGVSVRDEFVIEAGC